MPSNIVLFPKPRARWRGRLRRVVRTAGGALDQWVEQLIWRLLRGGKFGWH